MAQCFPVRNSLNSYKMGSQAKAVSIPKRTDCPFSAHSLRAKFCPSSQEEQQQLAVAMPCAGTGSLAGNVWGIHSPQVIPWPEPRAGKGSPAAEMLQAGSAVAPGMVDAPGLVPQGWDWISDSICALHWDPVFLNISGTFVHTVPKCLWNFSWSFLNRSFAEAAHLHLI